MNKKPYKIDVSDALKKLQNVAVGVTISRKSIKSVPSDADSLKRSSDDDITEEHLDLEESNDNIDDDDHEMIEFDELENDDDSSDVDFIPDQTKRKAAATRPPAKTRKSSAKIVVVNVESPPVYVCLMCKERFPSFEPLKDHMKNSKQCKEKYLKCDICSKVFDTKKGLLIFSNFLILLSSYPHPIVFTNKKKVCNNMLKRTGTNHQLFVNSAADNSPISSTSRIINRRSTVNISRSMAAFTDVNCVKINSLIAETCTTISAIIQKSRRPFYVTAVAVASSRRKRYVPTYEFIRSICLFVYSEK